MPNIRLKYDGWLALPVAARQKLGLSTGDELAIEITRRRHRSSPRPYGCGC